MGIVKAIIKSVVSTLAVPVVGVVTTGVEENITDAILTEDELFYITTEDGLFYLQLVEPS
jgi:uncharacterized membrane protein YvlD (DUF360 family)